MRPAGMRAEDNELGWALMTMCRNNGSVKRPADDGEKVDIDVLPIDTGNGRYNSYCAI